MRFRIILSTLCIFLAFTLTAQDLHFSQFKFAPLDVNPALTGAYLGTFRVGGIYRDQWASWSARPYRTANIYVDSPIIRGLRQQDWIGVGVAFDYDVAGHSSLKTTISRLNLAYHLSFDKKNRSILTLGGQYNLASVKVNQASLTSRPELNGGEGTDDELNSLFTSGMNGELDGSFKDWTFGLLMRNLVGKTNSFRVGLAASHLFSPDKSVSTGRDELPLRITGFTDYRMALDKKMTLTPTLFVQKQGPSLETVVQGEIGYLIKPEKGIVLNGGLGARIADAFDLQILLGVDIKDIKIGASYDMNLFGNSTSATSTVGGFEIGVMYIGKIYKKPELKPIIFCPRL